MEQDKHNGYLAWSRWLSFIAVNLRPWSVSSLLKFRTRFTYEGYWHVWSWHSSTSEKFSGPSRTCKRWTNRIRIWINIATWKTISRDYQKHLSDQQFKKISEKGGSLDMDPIMAKKVSINDTISSMNLIIINGIVIDQQRTIRITRWNSQNWKRYDEPEQFLWRRRVIKKLLFRTHQCSRCG